MHGKPSHETHPIRGKNDPKKNANVPQEKELCGTADPASEYCKKRLFDADLEVEVENPNKSEVALPRLEVFVAELEMKISCNHWIGPAVPLGPADRDIVIAPDYVDVRKALMGVGCCMSWY